MARKKTDLSALDELTGPRYQRQERRNIGLDMELYENIGNLAAQLDISRPEVVRGLYQYYIDHN